MNLDAWLDAATADAGRRGLTGLAPLLETLASATRALRESDLGDRAGALPAHVSVPAGDPSRAEATRLPAASDAPPGAVTGSRLTTIEEFGRRWRAREITSAQATERCLQRIAEADGRLNACILVTADQARSDAEAADRELAAGHDRGPLHGVPISIKDLFDLRGTPTTAASRVRDGHEASADATAVARLRRAGAVIVGKTNLHEFAFGTTNEDSAFGPSRHPFDPRRSPGGSSGGSAVTVATGMAMASLGTDTGGSIRIPAAACGIVGLKPGFGEVPVDGVVPLARTLDHVGPLTLTVRDAWTMYDGLMDRPLSRPSENALAVSSLRLAVPRRYFCDLLDDEVKARFEAALAALQEAGAVVRETDLAHASLIAPAYLHVVCSEAAAYHAASLESAGSRYTEPVRLRLEMARYVQAEDYARAMAVRRALEQEVTAALTDQDALALPTLPIPAPLLGAATLRVAGVDQPVRNLMLRLTQPFNLTGHPAVSLPCGLTLTGLPCGMQLVGHRTRTSALLAVAAAIEGFISHAG